LGMLGSAGTRKGGAGSITLSRLAPRVLDSPAFR
jgi:hypothetical protein